MPLLVVIAQVAACFGLGALAVRVLGLERDMTPGEHWTVSFAIGFGLLGWLVFPLGLGGLLSAGPLWTLLLAGALGVILLFRAGLPVVDETPDAIGKGLLVLIAVAFFFDLAEALAPPVDADTLAYHFNRPKQFIAAGEIFFIPQAWTGAVPLLTQMTYVPALALGGEGALTLWTMFSGWAAAGFLFVLCRRFLGLNWSLAVTLVFLTTPAVIYGGGSGQVEPKLALFVLAGAWAVARALETGRISYAVLAGFAAGFYAGSKYLGLLFIAAVALVVLFQGGNLRRNLVSGLALGIAAFAAGGQWYVWNAVHTGDPVFPMFFQWLGRDDLSFWTAEYDVWFKEFFRKVERDIPRSVWWFIGYPFKATFDSLPLFEAKRTGFGPFGMLILPLSACGAWVFRKRIRHSPLFAYAVISGLFYALWFFTGSSQRIRHLLPVLPLFLMVMTVAAVRFADLKKLHPPLLAALGLTLIVQLAGHGVFSLAYLKHLAGDRDRQAFLERNVLNYSVVPWINANLGPKDRLFLGERQILYYLDVPYFYGSPSVQASVELRPDRVRPQTLYKQLKSVGITHVLYRFGTEPRGGLEQSPWLALREMGCLAPRKKIQLRSFKSRTLPGLNDATVDIEIFKLNDRECLL